MKPFIINDFTRAWLSFIVLKLVVEKLFLKPVKNRESPLQKESYM
jgi:hypothetical protein